MPGSARGDPAGWNHRPTTDVLPGADRIERYTGELVSYVRSLFPMRFYHGEKWWSLYMAAALLRLADMADSVLAHMQASRDQDAWSALRSMYELVVTVAWVLIEPAKRRDEWEGEALIEQLKLHNDLATFGETLLPAAEVAAAQSATGMPPLTNRAEAADKHWSPRIEGLYAPTHLLSFRGLYNAIYRFGSRTAHGSIGSVQPYFERQPRRLVVRQPEPESPLPYALVSPLLAMALTVVASEVKWIDEAKVRAINDEACRPGPVA